VPLPGLMAELVRRIGGTVPAGEGSSRELSRRGVVLTLAPAALAALGPVRS
jgi:hypothetical protein